MRTRLEQQESHTSDSKDAKDAKEVTPLARVRSLNLPLTGQGITTADA